MLPDNSKNRYSKDKARKGDTQSLNKAIGVTTTEESNVDQQQTNGEDGSSIIVGHSALQNRYESGGANITSDTEAAKASQKMYKTTASIIVDQSNQANQTNTSFVPGGGNDSPLS